MQKQLGRVGRASGRSTKNGARKKSAEKKQVTNKRAARERAHGSARKRANRPFSSLSPRENLASMLSAGGSAIPVASPTTAEGTKSIVAFSALLPGEKQACALSAVGTSLPQASTATMEEWWESAMRETTNISPTIMSLFGWRTYRLRMQQKRLALQLLVVNGSVRPGNVDIRYSADPNEAGTVCRSIAVPPRSDNHSVTSLQVFYARLRTRGVQLVRWLRIQEACTRLQSCRIQLLEWVRRSVRFADPFRLACDAHDDISHAFRHSQWVTWCSDIQLAFRQYSGDSSSAIRGDAIQKYHGEDTALTFYTPCNVRKK